MLPKYGTLCSTPFNMTFFKTFSTSLTDIIFSVMILFFLQAAIPATSY